MAGQSAVFTKSRRAGKSASFHIILKYGGAIRFLKKKIKEDREIHIFLPYFNYGRVIRIKNKQKARFRFFEKVKDGRAIRFFFSFLKNLGWQEYLHPFTLYWTWQGNLHLFIKYLGWQGNPDPLIKYLWCQGILQSFIKYLGWQGNPDPLVKYLWSQGIRIYP